LQVKELQGSEIKSVSCVYMKVIICYDQGMEWSSVMCLTPCCAI